jgi:hypothetical protein
MSKYSIPIPCLNCVCVPVCRQKEYDQLIMECSIISNFLYRNHKRIKSFKTRLIAIESILKPIIWESKWRAYKMGQDVVIVDKS